MIRKEVVECALKNGKHIEKVMLYATQKSDVQGMSTSDFAQGSMLFVVRTAGLYVLDEDGGAWHNAATGTSIYAEEG